MSLPNNPIDFVPLDLASVLGRLARFEHLMRKQRLYTFHVDTPNFGDAERTTNGTWKYIVATPVCEGPVVPAIIVKIGSDVPTPMGAGLSSIQVSSQHSSRVHAVIEFEGDALTLIDLGNEPGTRLNGARVSKIRVKSLDRIQLGNIDGEHTTIRYVGYEDIELPTYSNPQPFVERSPIAASVTSSASSVAKSLSIKSEAAENSNPLQAIVENVLPTTYHPIVIGKPTPTMKRSHDRKPLRFDHAPSRERAPVTITYPQLYHAIRLAAQVGEATAQTRKPAMDALSAFLIGLNVTPADFLPKEAQS